MRLLPPSHRTPARRVLLAVATVALAAGPAAPPVSQPTAAPALPPIKNEVPPTDPLERAADAALADRFEGLAEATFPAKVPTGPEKVFIFAQQAALMSAAATLDPVESRYPRKMAEALREAGDVDGEIDALTLAIHAKPDDEFSWIRSLDLHLTLPKYQTAADQVKYLDAVSSVLGLPPDVRSHALYRKTLIQLDQGKDKTARFTLADAIRANPLSGEARRLQYHRFLAANADPLDRAHVLMALLQSNPLQSDYARDLALVLADAGLVQESLQFFELSVSTGFTQGRPDLTTALDWAAELYISSQQTAAYGLIHAVLQGAPDYPAGWFLDLLILRSPNGGFPPGQMSRDLQIATNVMANRVAVTANALTDAAAQAGAAPVGPLAAAGPASGARPRPTTRPVDAEGDAPLPDVSAAVAVLTRTAAVPPAPAPDATQPAATQPAATQPAATQPVDGPHAVAAGLSPETQQLRDQFIRAVVDLAKLEIYFAKKPAAAAPYLEALAKLLPSNDPMLAELQGWDSFMAGDLDKAQTAFLKASNDNPLAALGIVQILAKQTPGGGQSEAATLLQGHPCRLTGAFLVDGLAGMPVRVTPKVSIGSILQQAMNAFPMGLIQNARTPAKALYSIHVAPVNPGRDYGQPLLAKITLFNFGPADLTIGNDGYIRPGILFQVIPQLGVPGQPGPPPNAYPAFDTWAGPLVVRRQSQVQQVVRVDQGSVLGVLDKAAGQLFQIDGQATTNPDAPLGGYTVRFTKPFARTAVNPAAVGKARGTLAVGPGGGTPAEQVSAVDQVQSYVRAMSTVRNLDPAIARDCADLRQNVLRLAHARDNASPAVAAWAYEADFALASPADKGKIILDLAHDRANWRNRQMGLVLAAFVPDPEVAKQVVAQLLDDPQASVRAYATADRGLLDAGRPLAPLPGGGKSPASPVAPGANPGATPAPPIAP